MKRKIKYFAFAVFFVSICITSVSAAQVTIKSLTSYSISSGKEVQFRELAGTYDYAKANLEIDSLTGSGSNKTVFIGFLRSGIIYSSKVSKTATINAGSCQLVSIGKIGKGTWQIENDAYYSSTNYVGWSGKLGFFSSSTA